MQQIPLSLPDSPPFALNAWQRVQWVKGSRFYEAVLHQDLWGQWLLTRRWGRRGIPPKHQLETPCTSYQNGLKRLHGTVKRRQQRGYDPLGPLPDLSGDNPANSP